MVGGALVAIDMEIVIEESLKSLVEEDTTID
jgi:hypothetical protein